MSTWEASWELEFPVEAPEELLLGLVVRDLLHGSSYDVQVDEEGAELAVDFVAGDEMEDSVYRLLISASVEGREDRKALREITEQVLEELLDEAEGLVARRQELDSLPPNGISFRPVAEDEERWDMVIPDWLAPDGAEVPFGFRPFLGESDDAWPSNEVVDAHGRVVLVPHGDVVRLYGIPAPGGDDKAED